MSDATQHAHSTHSTYAHTPGPWEVAKHGTTPGNTSIEVQTETGLPIAVMSYCGCAEENAALIALAPTLLAQRDALLSEVQRLIVERDMTLAQVSELVSRIGRLEEHLRALRDSSD